LSLGAHALPKINTLCGRGYCLGSAAQLGVGSMSASPRSNRPLVIASVMTAMFMIAIEATIVSTAMPQIAAQLGGLHLYSWVFASFLLTQTAMTVVFGKLSDLYGRKPVMLVGIVIFLVGSVLAGFAWSMPSMIVFRLVQGVGAGSIQPVSMTIVADLYPGRERGKIQGYLASVWAISAVLGPIVGSIIVTHVSWAWIFWMNLPVGLAAAAGFITFLHEDVKRETRRIDVIGAALFTVAVASLMIALTDAGTGETIQAWFALGFFGISTLAFVVQERRAADPMVSFALWSRRPIAAANGAGLLAGMSLTGLTAFLPVYVQGVLGQSSVVAGLSLTMMVVGWPAGATLAARLFLRIPLRQIMIAGGALIPSGATVFVFLTPESSPVVAGLGSLVMGLGMGLVSVSSLILIQEMTPWAQRGSATASNIFSRNLGSTLGATFLGAVLNYGLSHSSDHPAITSDELRQLLQSPDKISAGTVRLALHNALHVTFCAMLLTAVLIVILTLLVPAANPGRAREMPAE
jgi:EmrB/QacA subfamily drug resistance transporter